MFPTSKIPAKRLIMLKGYENYHAWKFFMKSVIEYECLDSYINTDFGQKLVSALVKEAKVEHAKLVKEAKVEHAKVKLMIITSISENILEEIPDFALNDSAYKIWCFLAKQYGCA